MNKLQIKFVEDALKKEKHLNDYERKFINDMNEKYHDKELSDAQNKTLNSIQRKLHNLSA